MTRTIRAAIAAFACTLVLSGRAGGDDRRVEWQKDLEAAEKLAREKKKLVLAVLVLGDLKEPDC